MRRYRTEIIIPPDRYIGLQLPSHLPEGRAVVTVTVEPVDLEDAASEADDEDRDDIEWWEEFERPGEAGGAASDPAPELRSSP